MKAIIVGSGSQALFYLRELSYAGFSVILVSTTKNVAWDSKYGKKLHAKSPEDLIVILNDIYKQEGYIPCHITSGAELKYICDNCQDIYEKFDVYPRPLKAVTLLGSKENTYSLAEELGFDIIETVNGFDVFKKNKYDLFAYPQVVKWNSEVALTDSTPFKVSVVHDGEELKAILSRVDKNSLKHILVQKFIPGDVTNEMTLQGYFIDGKLMFSLLIQKKRLCSNKLTSYLVESFFHDKEVIVDLCKKMMSRLNYSGLAEFEFKYDPTDNKIYLIEVNSRPCGLSSALKGKYPDFYKVFTDKKFVPVARDKPVEWMNIARDMKSISNHLMVHKNFFEVTKQLCTFFKPKSTDIFCKSDINPFFSQFPKKCIKLFRP